MIDDEVMCNLKSQACIGTPRSRYVLSDSRALRKTSLAISSACSYRRYVRRRSVQSCHNTLRRDQQARLHYLWPYLCFLWISSTVTRAIILPIYYRRWAGIQRVSLTGFPFSFPDITTEFEAFCQVNNAIRDRPKGLAAPRL